jgi:hypothetical protein
MLTEKVYLKLLKAADTKLLKWKLSFLSKMQVFSDLSSKELRGIIHFTKERRYVRGNVLFDSRKPKEGDTDPWAMQQGASSPNRMQANRRGSSMLTSQKTNSALATSSVQQRRLIFIVSGECELFRSGLAVKAEEQAQVAGAAVGASLSLPSLHPSATVTVVGVGANMQHSKQQHGKQGQRGGVQPQHNTQQHTPFYLHPQVGQRRTTHGLKVGVPSWPVWHTHSS